MTTETKSRHADQAQRGFALLVVLWTLTLLSLIGVVIGASGRSEARIARNLVDAAEAEAALDGAVQEAGFRLLQSAPAGWRADGEARVLVIGSRTVEVRIEEGAGRLNPNSASSDALQALLRSVGVSPGQATQLAQAIVDWRGGEGAQPKAMAAAPYLELGLPYGPPQARMLDIGEIALVAGMTPEIAAALLPHLSLVTAGPGMARPGPAARLALGGQPPAVGMGAAAAKAGPGVYVIRAATAGLPALSRRATVQLGCGVGALTCLRIVEWARVP